jgi:putative restriction endonuclease
MSWGEDVDSAVRLAAFRFLDEQVQLHGEVLTWALLSRGFVFRDRRVPLVAQQGIFKPAVLRDTPLTIRTAPIESGRPRPYDDHLSDGGLLLYRYRGTDPRHRDNVSLRLAMQRQTPMIYLYGVVPGQYMPVWPIFIVGDDPAALSFRVAVDESARTTPPIGADIGVLADARRRYVTAVTQRRLHQQTFRQRVLRAYQDRCAICRLRHTELLDAAHILPDTHPEGEPVVPNGLALCTLHHAAFDRNVIGVHPDLSVHVRRDVLEEIDGPMLRHGLQGFHGAKLFVPRPEALRPNPRFLAERYEAFQAMA